MNPHSASAKMETRLQFWSNYYQIQSNTLHFTTAFPFKKAIILEKSVLLWAHMHSREPEHSVLPLSTQLLMGSSQPACTKTVAKELLVLILYLFWGTSNWYSAVLGSSGLSCPVRDHFQIPLYTACSPWIFLLFRAEDGSESQVPPCPAPWWLLLCATLHAGTKLPAIIPKAAALCLPNVYPCIMAVLSHCCQTLARNARDWGFFSFI